MIEEGSTLASVRASSRGGGHPRQRDDDRVMARLFARPTRSRGWFELPAGPAARVLDICSTAPYGGNWSHRRGDAVDLVQEKLGRARIDRDDAFRPKDRPAKAMNGNWAKAAEAVLGMTAARTRSCGLWTRASRRRSSKHPLRQASSLRSRKKPESRAKGGGAGVYRQVAVDEAR